MSIINDALKKTELSIHKNDQPEPVRHHKFGANPALIFILILLIGFFIGKFISNSLTDKIKLSRQEKKSITLESVSAPSAPMQRAPVIEEQKIPQSLPAAPPTKTEKDFIINGIFFSVGDNYALINNQIVREKDSIDGAVVEKISTNSIELSLEGKTITLLAGR